MVDLPTTEIIEPKFLGTLFRTVLNIFFSELRVLYYRYEDI